MLAGIYASFSSTLPSNWISSNAAIKVVGAVPFMADSVLKNAGELKGNIALVSRDTEQVKRARGMISFSEKVTRTAEAGAVGVIFVDTKDHLQRIEGDQGYKCKIPVLMINSSDSSLLRERGSALIRDQGTLCL